MTQYDISLTITETMPVWKGDARPTIKKLLKLEKGDLADVTYLKMCAHTGTHIDAPSHFLEGGATSEAVPLDPLIGPALVVEDLESTYITKETLESYDLPDDLERLLIKTTNSRQWEEKATDFIEDFVAISPDGAQYLADRGLQLIGVDYLGVASIKDLTATHCALLQAGVVILEGIDLTHVPAGSYTLTCLPLKIAGSDGAPARAILSN